MVPKKPSVRGRAASVRAIGIAALVGRGREHNRGRKGERGGTERRLEERALIS